MQNTKTIQAVILAGGKGTRLAPLTEDTPKPLLPILGKSVLEHVYEKLALSGIQKVTVTTMYLPWQIESLGNAHKALTIEYVREQKPLGTAGAVRGAVKENTSDLVLVLSGDGIWDFDLKKAIESHIEKKADVTVITYQTENPLEYGVVLTDKDGKIERFTEKPPWAKVTGGHVNTGIYILNRDVIDRIPEGVEYDFAKELFPLLLAGKRPMYAYEMTGTWHDIGNLDEYFAANRSALDGKINGFVNTGLTERELTDRGIDVEMPVYVSSTAVLGKNIKLGAYTVIGDRAVIADGCDISRSVIGERTCLGMGCGIYGTLIGKNTVFGENCMTSEGCAVGGGAEIEDSVILPKYSVVHSGAHVTGGDILQDRTGKKELALFEEDGILISEKRQSPEILVRIGMCAASVVRKTKQVGSCRIGIMTDVNLATERLKGAILSGVTHMGVRSYDFGEGFEAMARYAAMRFFTDIVLYVGFLQNGTAFVKFFDSTGLDAPASFERDFANLFYGVSDYTVPERFYTTDRFENIWTLYYSELIKSTKSMLGSDGLKDFHCYVTSDGKELATYSPAYTAISAISELGGTVENLSDVRRLQVDHAIPIFSIDSTGLSASCIDRDRSLDRYHIGAILIDHMPKDASGAKLYLSSDMPQIYWELAKRKNTELVAYTACTHKDADLSGDGMLRQLWLTDGVYQTLALAALLKKENVTPDMLLQKLPAFAYLDSRFEGNPHRAGVMGKLAKMAAERSGAVFKNYTGEGVKLFLSGGSVTVIPGKAAGFRIISQATSTEAAKELCEKAEEFLK